jgi:hypothetical protein
MTSTEERWTPLQLLAHGRFASSEDLTSAVNALHAAYASPIIVSTFSAYYLLPTLSRLSGFGDTDQTARILEDTRLDLQNTLRERGPQAVVDCCKQIFTTHVSQMPATTLFGKSIKRPGDLIVAISVPESIGYVVDSTLAQHVVLCSLGSRTAAFHRNNSLDLWTVRQLRDASERLELRDKPASDDELIDITLGLEDVQTRKLLDGAMNTMPVKAIIAYNTDGVYLRHRNHAGSLPESLMPERRAIAPDAGISWPVPPQGSPMADLGELANLCIVRKYRLVGSLPDGRRCVGFPFGAEHVGSRPAGAICIVLDGSMDETFGIYEQSLVGLLATHFSRVTFERRWTAAVGFVTTHLREISSLGNIEPTTGPVGCAPELRGRMDIRLATPIVMRVLADIANLASGLSVTCRIIAGGDGPPFSRRLFRLHAVDSGWSGSPDSIPMDDPTVAVNAWVAIHGRAVYLRSIGTDSDKCSPDLDRYPGLQSILMVRNATRSELCVPVFAEGKLVGTINLEAAAPFAYDAVAKVVEECAQLIGVALLEARRQISVHTMAEAKGFLGRRHELDHKLYDFSKHIDTALAGDGEARQIAQSQIQKMREIVYMDRPLPIRRSGNPLSIDDVLQEAALSIEWMYKSYRPAAFAPEGTRQQFIDLSKTLVLPDVAEALMFGVAQALLNVRKYGIPHYRSAGWMYPVQYALARRPLGGSHTLYVAIKSVCQPDDLADLQSNCVFREPIQHLMTGRTSLGTFLTGEILRRSGGSAYFRVESPDEADAEEYRFVTAEFGVPILP